MNKSLYTYLLLITLSNFFNLRFLPTIRYGSDTSFLLTMGIIAIGFLYYRPDNTLLSEPIVKKYKKYLKYVWITIGTSIFSCYLFWDQSITQSILRYRKFFAYVLFFALIWIKPSTEEVICGFKYFTYTFLAIACCIWIFHLPVTHILYKHTNEISSINAIPGTTFIAFYFYHLLMKVRDAFNMKNFILASVLLIYFVINQNRSLLFPCLFFYAYTVYKTNLSIPVKSIIAIGIGLVGFHNFDLIQTLIDETRNQVNDNSYVRWEAIRYFLTELPPNLLCVTFGNGIISSLSNPSLWALLYSNMWNFNDVGWFGYYAFFGVAGIAAIFNIILHIILDKNSSSDIKMMLIHMCVPTIWALWMHDSICLFCLIIYIYLYRKVHAPQTRQEEMPEPTMSHRRQFSIS